MRVQSVTGHDAEEFGVTHIADGLAMVQEAGYLRLLLAQRGENRVFSLPLAEAAPASVPGDPVIGASGNGDIAVHDLAGVPRVYVFSSHANLLRHARLTEDGRPGSLNNTTTDTGYLFGVTAMEIVEGATRDLAVVVQRTVPGVQIFSVSDGGAITLVTTLADGEKSYLTDVADLASLRLGGRTYVATISATENGVSLFELAPDGRAELVDALGAADGLPIGGPADLLTLRHGETQFLLVAATLTSSITVLRVNPMGVMFPVDHQIDDRSTRFDDVAVLDGFACKGRAFVVAAGRDAGLTVMELLPDGRLSLVLTHVLESGVGLGAVTGIEVAVLANRAVVFLTDASGTRLHRVDIDLGDLGPLVQATGGTASGTAAEDRLLGSGLADTLRGGAGDDHLHDGAGGDLLLGEAGADVFVMARDGAPDIIGDFQDGVDLIDLSDWGRIYSASALSITRTRTGAEISFGTEQLTIFKSSNGALVLTDDDFLF